VKAASVVAPSGPPQKKQKRVVAISLLSPAQPVTPNATQPSAPDATQSVAPLVNVSDSAAATELVDACEEADRDEFKSGACAPSDTALAAALEASRDEPDGGDASAFDAAAQKDSESACEIHNGLHAHPIAESVYAVPPPTAVEAADEAFPEAADNGAVAPAPATATAADVDENEAGDTEDAPAAKKQKTDAAGSPARV